MHASYKNGFLPTPFESKSLMQVNINKLHVVPSSPHHPSHSQTMDTNGISISTHSKKQLSSHHGRDSGELAVFEASRYFSGDVDELSFSFASERFPWRHTQALPPQEPNERKLMIDKKLKTIASYIISFLLQRTSPKKRLPNNRLRRGRKRSSFYSCGSCGLGESEVWEEKKTSGSSTSDLTWRIGRTKSFDHNRFHHGNGHKALGELESGLFFENKKWVLNGSNGHGVEFFRRDDGEISDSSSDLFELRNIDELPVYG